MPRVPSAAAEYIGARIASVRRDGPRWTQDELAAATGIDSSNIRAYESGRAMPSVHSLVRLATALQIDPGELIQGLELTRFERLANSAGDRRRKSA